MAKSLILSVWISIVSYAPLVRHSHCFSPIHHIIPSRKEVRTTKYIDMGDRNQILFHRDLDHVRMFSQEDDDEGNVVKRFAYPKIDDGGLPLSDALFAQIVAPSFLVFWLSVNRAPIPTWLSSNSLFNSSAQGALVGPTLVHGAGLAVCWTMGALAARAYESDAFNVSGNRGYKEPIIRTLKAGAFATGLLVLSTQIDLFLEFGRYVDVGESEETDIRLLEALVEVINDVVFEAVILFAWRMYRASLTNDPSGRPPDYDPNQ